MRRSGIFILMVIFFAASWAKGITIHLDSECLACEEGEEFGVLLETANLWVGIPEERNAMVLARIPVGTKVKILEIKKHYYRVMYKNLVGYLDQQKVGLIGENLLKFQAQIEQTEDVSLSPQLLQTSTAKPVVQNTITTVPNYRVTKATSLREFPDSKAHVFLRFTKGDQILKVLDASDRYWWKVEFRGHIGWVKCALLDKQL